MRIKLGLFPILNFTALKEKVLGKNRFRISAVNPAGFLATIY